MAAESAVWGQLELPEAQLEAWLASEVGPLDFPAWPDLFQGETPARSVESTLGALESLGSEPPELCEVVRHENRIEVRAFLGNDGLLEAAQTLALPFLGAARYGGSGELVFLGARTARFGYRLAVGNGGYEWRVLTEPELEAAERSPSYLAVAARARALAESLVGGSGDDGPNPFVDAEPSAPRAPKKAVKRPPAKKPVKKVPAKKAVKKAAAKKAKAPAKKKPAPKKKAKAKPAKKRR